MTGQIKHMFELLRRCGKNGGRSRVGGVSGVRRDGSDMTRHKRVESCRRGEVREAGGTVTNTGWVEEGEGRRGGVGG